MAAHVTITLDTAAPAGPSIALAGGASVVSSADITAAIGTTDGDTTGYQMKIYGDVDDTFAQSEYRALEANAPWIAFNTSKNIRLASGNGSKTVRVKIRDDVWNVSAEANDGVTLDTTIPVISVLSGPTPARISKQTGKRTSVFTWEPDVDLQAYEVRLVANSGDPRGSGTLIDDAGGSINVAGTTVDGGEDVQTTIDGADLETAGVNGAAAFNGAAGIVKVFGQATSNGQWSA
jgi:hypothetical protein